MPQHGEAPEYSEAELKTMLSGYAEGHPKHDRVDRGLSGISPEEKARRRAKNRQSRASRKKNR